MGCCCGGLDTSGSILQFEPGSMKKTKPGQEVNFSGNIQMALYSNRLSYDGCTCCCGICQGEIQFNNIQSMETNNSSLLIQTKDGWRIVIGPLLPQQLNQVLIYPPSIYPLSAPIIQ